MKKNIQRAISLLVLWPFFISQVYANPGATEVPSGFESVAGTSSYSVTDATGTLVATGAPSISQFDTFNVGSAATFNAVIDSAHLSRVTGGTPSEIFGSMNVTGGSFFLVNPGGVYFSPTSSVNVNGALAVSTLDIQNNDFLNGNYVFQRSGSGSLIRNEGTISVEPGGYVALLGSAVSNEGAIHADQASAALAAADQAIISLDSSGLLSVNLPESIQASVFDTNGNRINDAIANSGNIQANGGKIILSAQAAEEVFDSVVNHSGVITAQTISNNEGEIVLHGGKEGIVHVSGQVNVSGDESGEVGGVVHILGDKVGLFDQASIVADGAEGGGAVLVGGDYLGKNPNLQNASATYIGKDASIDASALTQGDGGKIIIWSDDATRMYGALRARGGSLDGDGGFIETSGGWLDIDFTPDVSAAIGQGGEWLIDPNNLEIVAGAGTSNINGASPFVTSNDSAQLGVDLIVNGLSLGDVTVSTGGFGVNSQAGNLTWTANMDFDTIGTNNTLTLNAHNDITLNGSISQTGTDDSLNMIFNADSNNDGGGAILINNSIATGGGAITFQDGTYLKENLNTSTSEAGRAGGNITFQGAVLVAKGGGINLTTTGVIGDGSVSFQSTLDSGNSYTYDPTARTWQGAEAAAQVGAGDGVGHTYLATVTSSLENSIATSTAGGTQSWLGGSDAASEGDWRWVTGPEGLENGGNGRPFWSGAIGGSAVGGAYNNWNGGEPNDFGGGEDALQLGFGSQGQWNDFPDNSSALGSVVETNLAATDLTITAGTGTVTFSGAVGANKALGAVTVASGGNVNFNGAVTMEGSLTQTDGSGTTTFAAAGDIGANVSIANDIITFSGTGSVNANDGTGTVSLTAQTGAISSGAASTDITAASLTASAATGIGSGANPLTADLTTVTSATSATGGIAMNLLDADNSGVTVTSADATTAGDITLTATSGSGAKTYTSIDTNNGNISLTATQGNMVLGTIASDTGVVGANDITATATAGPLTVSTSVASDDDVSLSATNMTLTGTIAASDVTLLESVAGNTIGLGDDNGQSMIIGGAELQNITATTLTIGNAANGSITVDGISAANSNNVGTVTLNASRDNAQVIFGDTASTFNALTVNADDGIDVNVSVTTDTGALTMNGDYDDASDSVDNIDLAQSISLNAEGAITLSATTGSVLLSGGNGTTVTLDSNSETTGVSLGNLSDTNNPNLTVFSYGDITLAGATSLGTGTYTFNLDDNNNATKTLTTSGAIGGSSALVVTGYGNNDLVDIDADITSAGMTMQNLGSVDLAAGVDLMASSGNIAINSNVSSINLSGADTTTNTIDANGGAINLAVITDTNNPHLTVTADTQLSLAGATSLGTGNYSFTSDADDSSTNTLNVTGAITGNSNLTFAAGNTGTGDNLVAGADITATTLTIQNMSLVELAAGADLSTNNGALTISSNVSNISLIGADATTNVIDGNGDALVSLANIIDSNNPNLTVTSEGGITLTSATNLGTGTYSFTADNDNDSASTLTVSGAIAGNSTLTLAGGGTGTNDTLDANADISANVLTIQNSATVDLAAGVDLTSNSGALTVSSNVGVINLSGADATSNVIDGNGDALVSLSNITDTNNPNLTVNSEGGITLNGVNLGTGTQIFNADNDDDGSTTLSSVNTIVGGAITLRGGTGTTETIDLDGDVTAASTLTIRNAASVDLAAGVDLTTTNGALNAATSVTALNLSGADATTNIIDGNGDALTSLANITDTNNPNFTVNSEGGLTLSGASNLGTGTYGFTADNDNDSSSTLTVSGAISGNSTLTFSGGGTGTGDDLDANADIAGNVLTIQNFATADLAAGVDLTSNNGALTVSSNIGVINLSGADATTNVIDGNGDALVNLSNITDTNNPNLTVNSEAGITLNGVNLGTGTHIFNADNDDDGTATLSSLSTIVGGAITLRGGTGTTETIDLDGDVTAASTLTIRNAASVDLAAGVDLTTTNGALDASTSVTALNLSGADATTNIIDGNGDALTSVGNITDTNNPNFTVNSEGGITLAGASSLGTGTYGFTADNDNDSTSTLTVSGAITGNSTLTFSGGGTGTNDTFDVDADITAAVLTIQNFSSADLAAGVDLTSSGALSAYSNVTVINLSGASATTNVIDGNGDALVRLGTISDTNNVNLTIDSEGDLTLAGFSSLGSGTYDFNIDNDGDGTETFTLSGATTGSGIFTIDGTNHNDDLDFDAALTATSLTIANADDVGFDGIVTTTGALTQSGGDGTTTFSAANVIGTNATIVNDAITFSGASSLNANTGTGNVILTAENGGITGGTAAADVISSNLDLYATTGIGSSGNFISTTVDTLEAFSSGSSGIFISDTGGGLTIGSVTGPAIGVESAGGGITLRSAGGTFTVNENISETNGGNIVLSSNGSASTDDLTLNADVTASGGTGTVLMTAGDTVTISTGSTVSAAGSGAITVAGGENYADVTLDHDGNSGGDIVMGSTAVIQSEDGNITLDATDSIVLGLVDADRYGDDTRGDVYLYANRAGTGGIAGTILDSNVGDLNVRAENVFIETFGDVGTLTDPIELNVSTIASTTFGGGTVYLERTNQVTVNTVDAQSSTGSVVANAQGNVIIIQADVPGGTVDINANNGDITSSNKVVIEAGGLVNLDADGTIGKIDNVVSFNTPGPVTLRAAEKEDEVSMHLSGNLRYNELSFENLPPGLVIYNDRIVGGGNVQDLNSSISSNYGEIVSSVDNTADALFHEFPAMSNLDLSGFSAIQSLIDSSLFYNHMNSVSGI